MSYTETHYYKTVKYYMTPDNFERHVNERLYPSITLNQFEHSQPKLPSSSDAALNCMLSAAIGTCRLFYAIVIGLPTDWWTFKTHLFLLTWNQVKFDAHDAYAHALTVIEPLRGAYLQQENLFLREAQLAPKTQPETRTESVLPLPKKPIPTPPPPPPLPSSLLSSLNSTQLKKTGTIKVPAKKTLTPT